MELDFALELAENAGDVALLAVSFEGSALHLCNVAHLDDGRDWHRVGKRRGSDEDGGGQSGNESESTEETHDELRLLKTVKAAAAAGRSLANGKGCKG
jgi:hypothetical protein